MITNGKQNSDSLNTPLWCPKEISVGRAVKVYQAKKNKQKILKVNLENILLTDRDTVKC